MIELIQLRSLRAGQALSDHLVYMGIPVELLECSPNWGVFLVNSSDADRAQAIVDDFLSDPSQAKFLKASWLVGEHFHENVRRTPRGPGIAESLKRDAGVLTVSVLLISVTVYLLNLLGIMPGIYALMKFPSIDSLSGFSGVLRLITPIFLHFSSMHIIFNLLWWWQFGGMVERKQSTLRLLVILLVTGLSSNLMQNWFTGPHFGGMSGVVYGLLGYLWVYGQLNKGSSVFVSTQIVGFMLIWLVLGYTDIFTAWLGAMANAAHTFGLISGCLLGCLYGLYDKLRQA